MVNQKNAKRNLYLWIGFKRPNVCELNFNNKYKQMLLVIAITIYYKLKSIPN